MLTLSNQDFFNKTMRQCGIQIRKIVCGHARRTESYTSQLTEHHARFFTDQSQFQFEVSYTVSFINLEPGCKEKSKIKAHD